MQQTSSGSFPVRPFGRSDAKISILGFGGHHPGDAPDEKTAVRMVQEAVDEGSPSTTTAGSIAEGKLRSGWSPAFVGFTGHQNPSVHMEMLNTGFPFDAVQMPLNPFDSTFTRSFGQKVLPELNQRGIAVLGVKPLSGRGEPIKAGALTVGEALRYAMSLPVTTITGIDSLTILQPNLRIAQNFTPILQMR